MRVNKHAYARVQDYFPECAIVVEDLEAHVQSAESKMFPKKKVEQEAWLQTVVQAVLPKVSELPVTPSCPNLLMCGLNVSVCERRNRSHVLHTQLNKLVAPDL